LTITLIQSFELLTLLLIAGVLGQIGKHYILSSTRGAQLSKQEAKVSSYSVKTNAMKTNAMTTNAMKADATTANSRERFQNRPSSDYYFHKLPEPEVSFSLGQGDIVPSEKVAGSHGQIILNNYIDDFFSESPQKIEQELEQLSSLNYHVESSSEDEFITVMEERVEMVRAFELSNERISLVR